jgi:hypothetical protein
MPTVPSTKENAPGSSGKLPKHRTEVKFGSSRSAWPGGAGSDLAQPWVSLSAAGIESKGGIDAQKRRPGADPRRIRVKSMGAIHQPSGRWIHSPHGSLPQGERVLTTLDGSVDEPEPTATSRHPAGMSIYRSTLRPTFPQCRLEVNSDSVRFSDGERNSRQRLVPATGG